MSSMLALRAALMTAYSATFLEITIEEKKMRKKEKKDTIVKIGKVLSVTQNCEKSNESRSFARGKSFDAYA